MLRVLALVALAMIGCANEADDAPITVEFRLDLHVDTKAFPSFDHLNLYMGSGQADTRVIATPQILAGTEPAPAIASRWSGRALGPNFIEGAEYKMSALTPLQGPVYFAVVAFGGRDNVATAAGTIEPIQNPNNVSFTIKLDPTLVPELWGTASQSGPCMRLKTPTVTYYVVTRFDDADCDGRANAEDSQPYAYCDPSARSGPAHDACQ